ncbi:hypothetical protein JR334_10080 [Clostridia bacterium]|nr:hypothetical protein JR334_10080 [Clostridia bacterium]
MKKKAILPICFIVVLVFFAGCSSTGATEITAEDLESAEEAVVDQEELAAEEGVLLDAEEVPIKEDAPTADKERTSSKADAPAMETEKASPVNDAPVNDASAEKVDVPADADRPEQQESQFAEYVESGVLTQDEAEALDEYFRENMPSQEMSESSTNEMVNPLEGAVEEGIITQAQADLIDMDSPMARPEMGADREPGGARPSN